ncbi:MAG: VOC family protein [Ardenticatenales bacterium]|nr:VOC family protein [Ardenticatenales bacterium]
MSSIHPDTALGPVALQVASLERAISFYQEALGFQLIKRNEARALLGAANIPLLVLRERRGSAPVPVEATGLYHFAILVPSQAELGHALRRLIEARVPIGQGDHLVSEALYLSDPDGNGIEIYRDRPRETWSWRNGQVAMATDPVDLEGLLRAAQQEGKVSAGLPEGTVIGHVHLKVGDIPKAKAFYHGILGFDVVAEMPSALFVSAGGYHHHLGLNSWHSRNRPPAPADAAGLRAFTITVPDEALADVAQRLEAGVVAYTKTELGLLFEDPWRNRILVTSSANFIAVAELAATLD